jgi:hypothetical protein
MAQEKKYGSAWPEKPVQFLSSQFTSINSDDIRMTIFLGFSIRPVHLRSELYLTSLCGFLRRTWQRFIPLLRFEFPICLVFLHQLEILNQVFTYALFDLTEYPEYIIALREEAEQVVKELGWTKAALNRMHKIDSFLRESQRMHDNGPGMLYNLPHCPALIGL